MKPTAGNVLAVISNSESNFRTTESLTREFDIPELHMRAILIRLWREGKIRHPYGWEHNIYAIGRNEGEWWRYTPKGPTRAEKWRMVRALLSWQPISNGSAPGNKDAI